VEVGTRHRHPAIAVDHPARMAGRAAERCVVADPLNPPAGRPAVRRSGKWPGGRSRRSVAVEGAALSVDRGASPTEKSAMRITVVDIDLTHGRPADVLSTNSLSTGRRCAVTRMNA